MKWLEVTRDNYAAQLPNILKAISASQFITFDTELTGLCMNRASRYSALDEAGQRYLKVRDSAINFGLIQVGLTAFQWNAKKSKYTSSTYSFYLFPSRTTSSSIERRFSCQLSSISFLADNLFDFNKAFHKGIPFISRREEELIREQHAIESDEKPVVSLKGDDKLFVEEQCALIDAWLKDGAEGSLDLAPCNSFQRLLIYQQAKLRYESLVLVKKGEGKSAFVSVSKPTAEERKAQTDEAKIEFERSFQESVGFRKIIDFIAERKLPIVGHNCLLDLCHIFHKFIAPCPQDWSDFKALLHEAFPVVIDTKYMASSMQLLDNALEDLTAYVKTKNIPLVIQAEPAPKFHDAGFDSFCTGRVFLGLLSTREAVPYPFDQCVTSVFSDAGFANRIYAMQSDYAFFRLDSPDVVPDRSRVLFFGGLEEDAPDLPSTLTTSCIQEAVRELVGVESARPQVMWASGSSFFVIVEDVAHIAPLLSEDAFRKRLSGFETEDYSLLPYSKYSSLLLQRLSRPKRRASAASTLLG